MRLSPAVALLVTLGSAAATAASFEPVREVHVLAGPTRTTLRLSGDRVLSRQATSRASGGSVPVPRSPLAEPDRVVWLVGTRVRTRVAYVEGVEVERRSFDLDKGRELRPDYHLSLPASLAPAAPVAWPARSMVLALQDVVQLGYYRGIMSQLAQIEQAHPECGDWLTQLRTLARQFQFEAMGRLLAPALDASTATPP